jgi:hypothetical protein
MTEKVVFEFWYHFSSLKNHPNGPPVRDAGKALERKPFDGSFRWL